MQIEDKPRFLEAITALAALFSRELDDAAIALYWEAVRSVPLQEFQAAVAQAAKTCGFFPPPTKLLEFAGLDPESNARTAWSRVIANGMRGEWSVDDPLTRSALAAIGGSWRLRHATANEMEGRIRNEFIEQYRLLAAESRPSMLTDGTSDSERVREAMGGDLGSLVKGID